MIIGKVSAIKNCQINNKNGNSRRMSPSFGAKKLPSGIYSDWFYKQVEEQSGLSEEEYNGWVDQKLNSYLGDIRYEIRDPFAFIAIDKDMYLRQDDYKNLRLDLNELELKKKEAEIKHEMKVNIAIAEFEKEKLKIKEELNVKFCDLIQREKEGQKSVVPNCIMLEGKEEKLNEEFIKWTAGNSNCNFVEISKNDNILDYLEKAQENYDNTGNKTLLYVKNMPDLINPKKVDSGIIASMKSIMTDCSEEYNATMIFSCKNSKELDHIALQPHRVRPIKVDIKYNEPELIIPEPEEIKDANCDKSKGFYIQYSSEKDYERRKNLKEKESYDPEPYDPANDPFVV